jgi:hypothetical protein
VRLVLGARIISEELTMTKSILVSLAVLTLATSAALAATHKTTHHRHATSTSAAAPASPASAPVFGMGGVSADREMYIKNQRDSGLNPRAR